MKSILFAIVMFVLILSVPYVVNGGVVLDAKNKEVTIKSWTDPNNHQLIGQYYISKDGLLCANQIWQVTVNGLSTPVRKCRLPDGAWATFYH
jgi:hypothetical protein